MDDKDKILKSLKNHEKQVVAIVNGFEALDKTEDRRLNRLIVNNITMTLFELLDTLVNTEVDIYNYMQGRK